jgi:hypothetical protein
VRPRIIRLADRPTASLLALLAVSLPPAADAQSLLSGDEQNVVNFAFATQLGSGVYSVSGRTLQVYRFPFGHALKDAAGSRFGVELTLPVTFGFYDFELQDVADGDIPDSVDSVSFMPGLTFGFRMNDDWKLEPYVEAGLTKARDADADATVYAGGLVSLYEFEGTGFDWQLRNDLAYAGVDLHGTAGSDHLTRFQTVVTARRAFQGGGSLDYLAYAQNDWYFDQPEGPVDSAGSRGDSLQYEVGVTLGFAETRRIWGIPLPRVGIGYRFGADLDAWRIVFGTPYK